MTNSLPTIISEYMAASDRRDVDAVVACFTDDAVVVDEDQRVARSRRYPPVAGDASLTPTSTPSRCGVPPRWNRSTASNVTTCTPISRATSPAAPSI